MKGNVEEEGAVGGAVEVLSRYNDPKPFANPSENEALEGPPPQHSRLAMLPPAFHPELFMRQLMAQMTRNTKRIG